MTRALVVAALLLAPSAAGAKVEKVAFTAAGTKRTYYLFVPDKPAPMPLLLLLHGSGRNGRSLVDPWLPLARSEGIVLVAPDAIDSNQWTLSQDGPEFMRSLIETVTAAHDVVDRRRMYVFGHSAGAICGLDLGALESEYFAAVAVHAGMLSPEVAPIAKQAPRRIPIAIWVGTNDAFFPVKTVRESRDLLTSYGFDVKLTEIPNHTHDYYGSAGEINKEAWTFLQQYKLSADPKFQEYDVSK